MLTRDSVICEGKFSLFGFDKKDPKNEWLIYENENQLQRLGNYVIAERMCGKYTNPIPYPYLIKASAVSFSQLNPNQIQTSISPASQIFPGVVGHPEYTVDNDSFELGIMPSSYERQYIEGKGLFGSSPPITDTITQEFGTFYHFGFFSRPVIPISVSTTSTGQTSSIYQDIMIAYHYIDQGVSYPDGIGVRVVWQIFVS